MKLLNLFSVACLMVSSSAIAQTFTSTTDGLWTIGSNWGGTAPPLSGQSSGSVTVQNNINTGANYSVGSFILNVQANKTLTVNGNLTESNSGGTINVYGTLVVTGDLSVSSNFNIFPGGTVDVYGNTYVYNNNSFVVGTNVAPPPYANFIAESNVSFASGGAGMTVNQNGRVAIYGNLTSSSGGGATLTVNNGGQMYVNGNVAFTGGGDNITNNNSTNPYGLYVNGATTSTGGGSTTTGNEGNKSTMQSTNPGFYSWVQSQHNSPLPVTLISFTVFNISDSNIQLTWSTASELNFDYFEIERSTDGKNFTSIGRRQGNGTTNLQHNYEFTDSEPLIGNNYYRLRSIDFDGFAESFPAIVADFVSKKNASVYPNPVANGQLHIDLNFEGQGTSIKIIDLNGVQKETLTSSNSQNSLPLSLDPGLYLITIIDGSFKQVSRLVVK